MKRSVFGASAITMAMSAPALAQPIFPAQVVRPVGIDAIAPNLTQASTNAPQTTATAAGKSASAQSRLQEIVVAAQKRAENLQRVPTAVVAAPGADLTSRGVTSSLQFNTIAPG